MRKELSELMKRVSLFDDSPELAEVLRRIAEELDHSDSYFLKEAAINLEELWLIANACRHAEIKKG